MKRLVLFGLFVLLFVSLVSADGELSGYIGEDLYSIEFNGEEIIYTGEGEFLYGQSMTNCDFEWVEKEITFV